jgi:energy-coupling factor transport system ATP-binding protein
MVQKDVLIEARDFGFTYKNAKVKAVQHINFKVHKGDIFGIIGPTGAGKTTVCRAIVGIVPQIHEGEFEGSLTVLGRPVVEYSMPELSSIAGYVHQDAESQLLMTNIEREIVFPLENLGYPRDEIKDRLEKALHLVHLENYRTRHPFYLSGGQRQRVVLATALAMNPDILILDEATSEIDPIGVQEIMAVVKELNEQGKTIILIEHNMEELSRYADHVMVLESGRLVEAGEMIQVLADVEMLDGLDIYPPEVTQLFIELKKRGLSIDKIPVRYEDAERMLADILSSAGEVG